MKERNAAQKNIEFLFKTVIHLLESIIMDLQSTYNFESNINENHSFSRELLNAKRSCENGRRTLLNAFFLATDKNGDSLISSLEYYPSNAKDRCNASDDIHLLNQTVESLLSKISLMLTSNGQLNNRNLTTAFSMVNIFLYDMDNALIWASPERSVKKDILAMSNEFVSSPVIANVDHDLNVSAREFKCDTNQLPSINSNNLKVDVGFEKAVDLWSKSKSLSSKESCHQAVMDQYKMKKLPSLLRLSKDSIVLLLKDNQGCGAGVCFKDIKTGCETLSFSRDGYSISGSARLHNDDYYTQSDSVAIGTSISSCLAWYNDTGMPCIYVNNINCINLPLNIRECHMLGDHQNAPLIHNISESIAESGRIVYQHSLPNHLKSWMHMHCLNSDGMNHMISNTLPYCPDIIYKA